MFSVAVLFWTRRGAWCLVSGEEDRGSCLEALGERTKKKGAWLVISLDMKELEWPVGRSLRLEGRTLSLLLGS